MANCYLHIGVGEYPDGDIFPETFPLESLIPASHEHLFRFIDFDLFTLEEPLKRYLSCLHDNAEPDKKLLHSIIMDLRRTHPFFMLCAENVQSFLNQTIADYIRYSFPAANLPAQREMFSKAAFRRYRIDSDPKEMLPENVGDTTVPDHIVNDLFNLQERIRRLVFITLDDTNQSLAKLPTSRRVALYSLAYSADSLAYITANFGVQPSDKMKKYILETEFDVLPEADNPSEHEDYYDKNLNRLRTALDHLYWKPDEPMPPAFREVMLATADVTDSTSITYNISSLSNLMDLEVYRMITEETRIRRCKNCHKYFVPTADGQEYCSDPACAALANNIEAVLSKPHAVTPAKPEIPSTIESTQQAKKVKRAGKVLLSNCPSYNPYRTVYRKLKARIKAGTMTREEFGRWNDQALARLHLVADGKMAAEEYEQWLAESC